MTSSMLNTSTSTVRKKLIRGESGNRGAISHNPLPMRKSEPSESSDPCWGRWHAVAICGLALAATIVFADVLAAGGAHVLSNFGEDVTGEFAAFRSFGFGQLAHGRVALWNPYLYGGVPFLGNFQSALLYPPNWIYLLLPVNQAINVEMSFHVLLGGLCMYAWCAYRGLHPLSGFLAGLGFMFCGEFYAHVFAGHLPHLDVIAWAPLVMLAVDDLTLTRSLRGVWLGAAAVAMQILAGHPQFVFYTAVGAGLYALLNLRHAPSPARSMLGLVLMFSIGGALAAAQLVPGLAVGNEGLRTKLDMESAEASSLPPEAVSSLITPGIFGPFQLPSGNWRFWGRTQLWDSCLFAGVTVLSLALFACRRSDKRTRRFAATVSVAAILMAMGHYTPLFHLLFHIPGFASFRAWGRFGMLTGLFLALLGGLGLDRLLQGDKPGKLPALLLGGAAAALLAAALLIACDMHRGPAGLWGKAIAWRAAHSSHSHYNMTAEFLITTARNAAIELARTGLFAAVLACIFWMARHDRRAAYLMVVLATIELISFARRYRPTFDWAALESQSAQTARVLHGFDGDGRSWASLQDVAMRKDCAVAWGYDATILKRYVELVSTSNGESVADLMLMKHKLQIESPVWNLLRVRSFVQVDADQSRSIERNPNAVIDRAMLVGDWRVVPDSHHVIATINDPGFDPRQTALLEQSVAPVASGTGPLGTVQLKDLNSDMIELNIEAMRPAIVVLAENYANGWQATPIGPAGQAAYPVLPVDETLRGIPVFPGKHHLLLQYRPPAVRIGAWISAVSLLLYAVIGGWTLLSSARLGNA